MQSETQARRKLCLIQLRHSRTKSEQKVDLAIRSFEKAGRCVRKWGAARNQFTILCPERFNK